MTLWATLYSLFLLQASLANAIRTNRTIDDSFGDSVTGAKPVYLPDGDWDDTSCPPSHCTVLPPPDQAFDHTWKAATYLPGGGARTAQFSFQGTDVYVFFILANNIPNAGTETFAKFLIDGQAVGDFHHAPTQSPDFQYNALVFQHNNMANTDHTLLISADGYPSLSFINFDYAIYTFDDGSTPAATSTVPTTQNPPPQNPPPQNTSPPAQQNNTPPPSPQPVTTVVSGITITTQISTSPEHSGSSPGNTAISVPLASTQSNAQTTKVAGATEGSGSNNSTPTINVTSADSNATASTHKAPVGAIVGGIIGGIVILAVLVFLLLCLCRRRKQATRPSSFITPSNELLPVPFTSYTNTSRPEAQMTSIESDSFLTPQVKRREISHAASPSFGTSSNSNTARSVSTGRSRRTHTTNLSASESSRWQGSEVTQIMEQNLAMKAQIEQLRAQMNIASDRAFDNSDDPPPGYTRRITAQTDLSHLLV